MLTRRFLTVKEVADLVQVSEASVRHWIKLRQLRAIDLGREWRVIPRDLEAFLATHATCGATSLPADAGDRGAPSPPRDGPSSAAAARGARRGGESDRPARDPMSPGAAVRAVTEFSCPGTPSLPVRALARCAARAS